MITYTHCSNNSHLLAFPATVNANSAASVSQRKHQIPWMELSTVWTPDCKTQGLCKRKKHSQSVQVFTKQKEINRNSGYHYWLSLKHFYNMISSLKANQINGSDLSLAQLVIPWTTAGMDLIIKINKILTFIFPVLLIAAEMKVRRLPRLYKSSRIS